MLQEIEVWNLVFLSFHIQYTEVAKHNLLILMLRVLPFQLLAIQSNKSFQGRIGASILPL